MKEIKLDLNNKEMYSGMNYKTQQDYNVNSPQTDT